MTTPPPAYDPDAAGGTSTTTFDAHDGQFLDSYGSLSGTVRNCAGGPTPWGTWLTCEETGDINPENGTKHGYIFEVPAKGKGDPTPLKAMGRFEHEAVAISADLMGADRRARPGVCSSCTA